MRGVPAVLLGKVVEQVLARYEAKARSRLVPIADEAPSLAEWARRFDGEAERILAELEREWQADLEAFVVEGRA